jgi:translocation and assembly module TamB
MLSGALTRRLLGLFLIVAAALSAGYAWLQTADGKRWLADRIEAVSSTPERRLEIGSLDGAIPFSPVLSGLSMADEEGACAWLTVDRIAVRMDATALLRRMVLIEWVDIGRVAMPRTPTPSHPPEEDREAPTLEWPRLPLGLEIERLRVDEVDLGAPVLGEPARFGIDGKARLGGTSEGLWLDLAIRRNDEVSGELIAQMEYIPDTRQLTTRLAVGEPEGGILARLAELPELPALTIDLSGDGTLDDWKAELTMDGGSDLNLGARIEIKQESGGHRFSADAGGRLAALVDEAVRPLVESETSLDASALMAADGRLRIDRMELAGGFGRASVTGALDLEASTADVELTLLPAAPERFAALIDAASWSALRLSASATGPFLEPSLDLSLTGDGVAHGDVLMESLETTIKAEVTGPINETESSIEIAADLLIDGLDPGFEIPPGLLTPKMRVATGGAVTTAGGFSLDRLTVDMAAARLSATGSGEGWGMESAALTATLLVPDFDDIGAALNQPLAGEATAELSARWDGEQAAVAATARFENLATGIAAADILVGASPRFAMAASLGTDGAIGVDDLAFSGKGLEMTASGVFGPDAPGIDWRLLLVDLAAVDPVLEGALTATGRLTGTSEQPEVTARLKLADASVAGYPVTDAQLDADFAGLTTRPTGDISLEAKLAGLPVRASAGIEVADSGDILVDALSLQLASLTADGMLALDIAGMTTDGELTARLSDLGDLEPLLGTLLSGEITADLSLSAADGRQMAKVDLSATGAGLPGVAEVNRANLALRLNDLLGEPKVMARLKADGIGAGTLVLRRLEAAADGSLDDLSLTIDLSDDLLAMNTRAGLALGDEDTRIHIADLRLRYADARASLAGPAQIGLKPGDVRVDGLALDIEGGRLRAEGRYGDESDLSLALTGIPLALARLAAPDLDLSGRLDGDFRLTGTRSTPQAIGTLNASGVTLAALRKAGLRGLDATTALDWSGGILGLSTSVAGDFGGPLKAAATLAAPADPETGLPVIDPGASLNGTLTGDVRLGLLNDLLAATGEQIEGILALDLALSGRLAEPRIGGSLSLAGGSLLSPQAGISLDDIRLRVNGEGDRLTIAELSARAPNGGVISATGNVGIDWSAGLPADISVKLDDALILNHEIVIATVRGGVRASGTLTRSLEVNGRLTIPEAEIRIPERLPPSIPTLEVKEVNKPPELAARRPRTPPTGEDAGTPLLIALDLAIDAPRGLFVRGWGLDAEVGGEVTVRGTVDAPDIGGGFQLRRGHLDALGRRFTFSEGVVTIPEDGSIDADIRFVVRTDIPDGFALINVTGRASSPQIIFDSVPELPQDEILAQVLFGKRGTSLSALESIQLARSALELTGRGAGPGMLDSVRREFGLDMIEIGRLGADESSLNLRRRIAENIDLGLKQGLESGSNRTSVEVQLTPNISLEADVGMDSTGRTGVRMEWEY